MRYLGILNLPTSNQGDGPNTQQYATVRHARWTTRWVRSQRRPLLIDDPFKIFANPYAAAVLAELQDRNIPFVAKDETLVRQLGPGRRYDGRNANELLLRLGDARSLRRQDRDSRCARRWADYRRAA